MELTKLTVIALVCGVCHVTAKPSHGIPVEGYETQLQVLGQHVEIPEPPVKVIRITKTIAIKVPVPYPVKVPHKVPYPVPISKPIPYPVPQIVHVPHPVPVKSHHQQAPLEWPHAHSQKYSTHEQQNEAPAHQVYEETSAEADNKGFQEQQGYGGGSYHNNGPATFYQQQSHEPIVSQWQGQSGPGNDESSSGEGDSQGYDNVLHGYLQHLQSGGAGPHGAPFAQQSYSPELDYHQVKQIEATNVDHLNYH